MKSRLLAVAIAVLMAGALTQCTTEYTDGKTTKSDGTLRPGGPPIGVDGDAKR